MTCGSPTLSARGVIHPWHRRWRRGQRLSRTNASALTEPALSSSCASARGSGLLRLDDRAADGAGGGEEVLELVAFAPAGGALQRGQVLGSALPPLPHRLAGVWGG